MTKTFTPNDVLRYLYGETDQSENKELEIALLLRSDLKDQYVQFTDIKEQLDQVQKAPSERTIQDILEYSNSLNPILS